MYYIIGFQLFQLCLIVVCLPLFVRFIMAKWQASATSVFLENIKGYSQNMNSVEARLNALEVRSTASSMSFDKKLSSLSDSVQKVPATVLRTIQGSVNSTSGKLGELVQFIELQRAYDRLIPVGNIVDFVAVKFPTEELPGVVHFIDVKTGKRAVLSRDQKKLKAIVESGLVEFHTVKMEVT